MGEFVWVRVNETNAENAAFLLEEQEEVFRVKWATVNQEEWLYKDEHTIVKPSGDRGRRARRAPAPAAAPVKKKRVKKETTKKGEDTGTAKEEGASAASKSQPAAKKAAAKTKPSQRASKKQSTKKKETTKKKRAEAAARYESNRTIADAKEAVVAALNKLPATPNKLPAQEEASAEEAKPASKREAAADPPAPLASAKEGPVEEEDIETEKDSNWNEEPGAAKNDAAQAAGLATKQPAKKKEPSKKNAKLTSQKEAVASPQSASTTSAPEKTAPISEKPASTKKAGAAKPNAAPVAKALPSKKETLLRKAIAAVLAPLPFPKSASTKPTAISEKPSTNKKDDNSNTPAEVTQKNAVQATAAAAIAQSTKKKTPTRKVRPASKMEVSPASAAAKAKLAKLKASTKQRAQPIDPPATGPTQQQTAASNNNNRPRKRTKRAEPEKSTKKAKKRKAVVATTDEEEEPPHKKTKSVTAQEETGNQAKVAAAKKKQTTDMGEGSNAKQAKPKESMQSEQEKKQGKSFLNEENPAARPSTPAQPNSEQLVGEKKGENTANLKQANDGSTTGITSLSNLPQDAIVFSCPHCGDDNVTQLKDEFLGKFLRLGVADHRNRRGVEMMDGHRDVEELDNNNEYKEQKDHVLNCLLQRLEAMGQKVKDKNEIPLECIPPLYRDRHLDVQNMQYKKMLKYQRVQYRTVKDQDRNREIERQLRVVYANPDVMKMLGWSHTDFPGGFVPDEVPPYEGLPKGDPN